MNFLRFEIRIVSSLLFSDNCVTIWFFHSSEMVWQNGQVFLRERNDQVTELFSYRTFKLFRSRVMVKIRFATRDFFVCSKWNQIHEKYFVLNDFEIFDCFLDIRNDGFFYIIFIDSICVFSNKRFVFYFDELGKKNQRCANFLSIYSKFSDFGETVPSRCS